jgi:hypothetical protein
MPDTISDFYLTQLKQLARQQKNINRKINLFNIWSIWACAFLIFSVVRGYRNLNGTNAEHFLLAMNLVFLLSLLSKFTLWKKNPKLQSGQTAVNKVILSCIEHLKNQQKLMINHLATFVLLLAAGLIFYLFYIPDTSSLFWIIITPVSTVVFVCSGFLMFKIKHLQKRFHHIRNKLS